MATTKAIDIINPAMSLIGVKIAGVDLTDDEITSAIRTLNNMMTSLDRSGIRLSYSIIEDKDDVITSPDWSFQMMESRLAANLSIEYNKNLTTALAIRIDEDMSIVRNSVVSISQPIFGDTLPTGSGHGQNCGRYNSNYFRNTEANDLLLGNGEKMLDDEGEQLEFEGDNEL